MFLCSQKVLHFLLQHDTDRFTVNKVPLWQAQPRNVVTHSKDKFVFWKNKVYFMTLMLF